MWSKLNLTGQDFIAQNGMIPPSQVDSCWRWPNGRNRSNIKICLWNWHIIYPIVRYIKR